MNTLLDAIYEEGSNVYNYLDQLYALDVNGEKNSKKFEEINIKYRDLIISLNQKLYELSKAAITGIDLKKYFLKKTEFNDYPKGFTVPFLIGIDANLIENYIFNISFLLFELDFNDKCGYNDDSCIKNNRDLHIIFLNLLEEEIKKNPDLIFFDRVKYEMPFICPELSLALADNNFDVDKLNYLLEDKRDLDLVCLDLENCFDSTLSSILCNFNGDRDPIMTILELFLRSLIVIFQGDLSYFKNKIQLFIREMGNEEKVKYLEKIGSYYEDDLELLNSRKKNAK
jgi:hypothetical protein